MSLHEWIKWFIQKDLRTFKIKFHFSIDRVTNLINCSFDVKVSTDQMLKNKVKVEEW